MNSNVTSGYLQSDDLRYRARTGQLGNVLFAVSTDVSCYSGLLSKHFSCLKLHCVELALFLNNMM